MKKKIVISILIVLVILVVAYVAFGNPNKKEEASTSEVDTQNDDNYFGQLIQYKVESVKDEENLNELLKKLELGEYLIDIKEEFDGEKEYITLYYDCVDENKVKQYFKDCNKVNTLEKNNVILFALIDKLEKISYKFTISDLELASRYSLPTQSDGSLIIGYPTITRENIEIRYNQDVRNYAENPSEFMQYAIELNVSNITIYMIDYESKEKEVNTIEISDRTRINNITQYIKDQNFGVDTGSLNSICKTWVDLNNGYIIGLVGNFESQDYGIIIKGSGNEIFEDAVVNPNETSSYVYKTLPTGLSEYIKDIIEAAGAQ